MSIYRSGASHNRFVVSLIYKDSLKNILVSVFDRSKKVISERKRKRERKEKEKQTVKN